MTRPVVLEDRLDSALRAGDAADRKRPVVPSAITDTVAPLGPNARAMLEERVVQIRCRSCDHVGADHRRGYGACWASFCNCRVFDAQPKQPSPRPTVVRLLADTKAVILRRRQECYGALAISDEQADELSRALVQNLLGNYEITGVSP